MSQREEFAAYGGFGWSPRRTALQEEIGGVWTACGVDSEWQPLKKVLLHRPGPELEGIDDPNAAQLEALPEVALAQKQHDSIHEAFLNAGVTVHLLSPKTTPPPNLMFVADLMFMTPEGAILGRPASTVRAGEERLTAGRLASLGIPIVKSVRGLGTFEGADAAWLSPKTVLLATGLRTNGEGAAQVSRQLEEMDIRVVHVELPRGAMHLMGILRFADKDLAVAWPGRTPDPAIRAVEEHGYQVIYLPDEDEAIHRHALNFVTLAPRRILMADGNPRTRAFYEAEGIHCETTEVGELLKAAGGIACLTGVLERQVSQPDELG